MALCRTTVTVLWIIASNCSRSNDKKYLYVGCGNHRLDGFTHVEINYAKRFAKNTIVPEPEILCDITENIPVQTRTKSHYHHRL